ncbi:MAG TPA: nickel pincer cofactor biosynthesis protein LarB [Vicinamibacteria bacterium]|jgi:NCAIR mutase (PurE)-related protein
MNSDRIRKLLEAVSQQSISVQEASEQLRLLPFEDLGFAKVDHHRQLRRGFPEVIFGLGKTPEQIAAIAKRLSQQDQNVLVTKTVEEAYRVLTKEIPDARWHSEARCIVVERNRGPRKAGMVVVISAGTSDIPIAEEAAITADLMGSKIERVFDVGVAGIHRLASHQETLGNADVVVVAAGMEGALPSVVSGLVAVPVVAVPTSIGYGASFGGLSALLAMLNSCSPGVAIVNIDNGFGAGYLAGLINSLRVPRPPAE